MRLQGYDSANKNYPLSVEKLKKYFRLTISPLIRCDMKKAIPGNKLQVSINGFDAEVPTVRVGDGGPVNHFFDLSSQTTYNIPNTQAASVLASQIGTNGSDSQCELRYITLVFEKIGTYGSGPLMVLLDRSGNPTSVSFPFYTNGYLSLNINASLEGGQTIGIGEIKGETFDTLDPTFLVPEIPSH